MDSFCRFSGDSSEKFALQEIRCKSCILVRSERIVAVWKKSILYSYTHLVHSFVAETHFKLYISLIRWKHLNSDDLQRRKRSPKNVVSIENYYPDVLVSVSKFLFEQHLSSRILNKPLDDTVIRAQSTLTNIL